MNRWLPLGTIVLLKNGSKPIMIYGRQQISERTNKKFDYLGCLYPEGYISSQYNVLFNKVDIDRILFEGFVTEEEKLHILDM